MCALRLGRMLPSDPEFLSVLASREKGACFWGRTRREPSAGVGSRIALAGELSSKCRARDLLSAIRYDFYKDSMKVAFYAP